MAAFENKKDDDVISSINIIPFVDIVLVLLIIFMVTSTAIVKAAIRVDLPKAANAGTSVATTVNLVLTKEREIFLDGDQVTRKEAGARIRSKVDEAPDLQVVISADTLLPYGEVVRFIDFVKGNGVQTFALNIEKEVAATK
jgi:biopolymer transport protein ExbD